MLYFLLVPVFAVAGAFLLYNIAPSLAIANITVRLAKEIRAEKKTGVVSALKEVAAFKESGKTESALFEEAGLITARFRHSAPWAGVFLGISFGIGMISLSIRTKRTEYKPHQGKCYSCGRCFRYCPIKVKV
jgi:ferredoxin